jgi:hypothetical protein
MHYNFFFNGCSITYGAELEGINNDIEHLKRHRSSHLVASHFNKTHSNIAVGGSTNDIIVKRTIDWFEDGNTCDMAIIQFTFKERVDWYDGNRLYPMGPNYKRDVPNYKLAQSFYYKTFYTDYLGNQNLYKNIFLLKTYFELKNIKHYFFGVQRGKQHQKGWELHCDRLFTIKEDIEEFKPDYDPKYQCPEYHPNELGHQVIANYIIEQVQHFLTKSL